MAPQLDMGSRARPTRERDADAGTILCPQCGTPARITERFRLGSTDGPVEHLKTGCVNNHWLTPLAEMAERERPTALDRDLAQCPPDPIRLCTLLGIVGRAAEEPKRSGGARHDPADTATDRPSDR